MAGLPPRPVLNAPTPTIQTSRPSDDQGTDQRPQILHQIGASLPAHHTHQHQQQQHSNHQQFYTGSSALGGTDLEDDFLPRTFDSFPQTGTLAPPHKNTSNNRRSSSPRIASPGVGTIGGHRSPANRSGSNDDVPHSEHPITTPFSQPPPFAQPPTLGRQGSQDSLSYQSVRSTSPRAASPLGANFRAHNAASPATASSYHAYRASSPSFASAVSHQSSGRTSPLRSTDRPHPSLHQVINEQRNSNRVHSPSPAPSDRPASRLDFSKLQQRQNSAAAAAAAAAQNEHSIHPASMAASMAQHRGTPTFVFSGDGPAAALPHAAMQSPELIQPRPEMPPRAFSEASTPGTLLSPAPDQVTPASSFGHQLGDLALKADGYPFPATHSTIATSLQQQQAAGELPPTEQRLHHVETALEQLNKGLASVADSVGWLIQREKERDRKSSSGSRSAASKAAAAQSEHSQPQSEELRMLNQQVSVLSNSFQQLMALQQNVHVPRLPPQQQQQQQQQQQATQPAHNNPSLNGLGFGPQGHHSNRDVGATGATSPLYGPFGASVGASPLLPPNGDGRAVSPRPAGLAGNTRQGWSGSPRPDSRQGHHGPDGNRRWSHLPPGPGGPLGSFAGPNAPPNAGVDPRRGSLAAPGGGAHANQGHALRNGMTSPVPPDLAGQADPNGAITKWEHMNLQPDLLRAVLKYGLGPPNKIQQRALPFLLRGSDIIAQAPPTQERIASYVIPSLQTVLNTLRGGGGGVNGDPMMECSPIVIMITTTVDQATQAQRMALGLGSPLGVRVQIAAAASVNAASEAHSLVQNRPHILVGTPAKISEVLTSLVNLQSNSTMAAINLADVSMVVLDEVDQMIARNLSDHVGTLLRILPPPTGAAVGPQRAGISPALSPGLPASSGPAGHFNPFDHAQQQQQTSPHADGASPSTPTTGERQMVIFSNTVPQDVLNFAQSIHLRESVRVLVRREGTSVTQHPPPGSAAAAAAAGGGSGMTNGGGGGGGVSSMGPPGAGANGRSGFAATNGPGMHHPNSGYSAPSHAMGSMPVTSHAHHRGSAADARLSMLQGLRQYYLYIAVPGLGSGVGVGGGSAFSSAGGEMKLEVMSDLLEDMEFTQAVVYAGSPGALEAVTYKIASRGIEALALHRDMAPATRQQVIAKFRSPMSTFAAGGGGGGAGSGGSRHTRQSRKVLIAYDVPLNPREVHQIPLILFYDLPRGVEEYKDKLLCGASGSARPSVCINLVTSSGGDVDMVRGLEAALGCKMAEVPLDAKSLLHD